MTDADLEANGVEGSPTGSKNSAEQPDTAAMRVIMDHNAALSADEQAIVDGCRGSEEVARFSASSFDTPGPWDTEIGDAMSDFGGRDDVEDVLVEYRACLKDAGLTPDVDAQSPYAVVGEDGNAINEEQIELALTVVGCKDQTDLVPRLSTIVAEIQAPIIEKYASELVALQTERDAVLAAAKAYLAEHA